MDVNYSNESKKIHIYADHAATTPLNHKAYESMLPYLLNDYGNASQPYVFARSPKKALKEARAIIAECIGAIPEEIFFTSCGTESNNWVINGAIRQNMSILVSSIEHHAIIKPCLLSDKTFFLPVTPEGIVLPTVLERMSKRENALVSIMYANNEIGTIEPVDKLVSIAHSKGFLFHTDAVQAIGHTFINVHELDVDMLSASAHKFNGPKGIGFLYIKKGVIWPSFIIGGTQEYGHRAGTENIASIVGMAVALQENINSLEENMIYVDSLESQLLNYINESGIKYKRNGDSNHIVGNVSLSFPDKDGEAILHRLDLQGISISTGSACDSENTKISHVLKAINLEEKYAKGTVRISLGSDNTEQEVKILAEALIKAQH